MGREAQHHYSKLDWWTLFAQCDGKRYRSSALYLRAFVFDPEGTIRHMPARQYDNDHPKPSHRTDVSTKHGCQVRKESDREGDDIL